MDPSEKGFCTFTFYSAENINGYLFTFIETFQAKFLIWKINLDNGAIVSFHDYYLNSNA